MRYMLDTNICIYLIKKKPSSVVDRFMALEPGEICISSIVYSELVFGVEKSDYRARNRRALTMFLALIPIVDYGISAAECYGRIRADLENKGTPIGNMDTMIAAHAMAEGCVLVSNNLREFDRIEGLKTENWAE